MVKKKGKKMNNKLASQLDWWWVADRGLVDHKTLKPLSQKKRRMVLVKEKTLVLIYHEYDSSTNIKTKSLCLQPIHGKITLQDLSDALYTIIDKDSEFGLEPFKLNSEDEFSIVSFIGFDS